jgi:hypothetical protein
MIIGAPPTELGTAVFAIVNVPSLIELVGGTFTTAGADVSASWARCRDNCPADFNGDGAANSQDFFDFLTTFFSAC